MNKKLIDIKCVIEELLKYIKKYNDGSINYQIRELERALEIIEFEPKSDNTIEAIREIQRNVYPPRGGLSDFYVWNEDEDERIKVNKPISELGDKLWSLLR